MPLQSLEVHGKLEERCAVSQGPRLALDDSQIMSPAIDGAAGAIIGCIHDSLLFAADLPTPHDQEVDGLDAHRVGPVVDAPQPDVTVSLPMHAEGGWEQDSNS